MKLFKKGWQKNPNILGKVTGEYEIKTFKGNQRVRSPIAPQFQTMRRSPNIQKGSQKSDSNLGEMFYMEPNDTNFRRVQNNQNMSPLNDSNNINMRSPLKESNYEYNEGNIMMPPNNNLILNDATGNIFLDQPMQQVEYNQTNENSNIIEQGPNLNNQRELLYPMNPRDFQEPSPGILRKMSPKQNVEGDSDTNSEKNDNVNEINDLKTQLDKNMHAVIKNEDGVGIGDKNLRNRGDIENIEIMAKSKEFQDNNTNSDNVKKLIKYYVKTYDETKPDMANGSSTITVKKSDIGADGYKIPAAMYLEEATNNDTGSLSVNITCDTSKIAFAVASPTDKYYSSAKNVTLATGSGSTDRYITFGGIMDDMDGYIAPGRYQFGCEPFQKSAGTDNYFLGLSWMSDGRDYAWAGSTSTAYPLYVFNITLASDIAAGTYHVDIMNYDTDPDEKITVMTPMIEAKKKDGEASRKYTKEDGNLKTEGLTIVVEGSEPGTVTTTTTTPPTPQVTTTTTTKPIQPSNAEFKFTLADPDGKSAATVEAGQTLMVSLLVDAGNNTCAGFDAQYDLDGVELVKMGQKSKALADMTLNTNPAEARVSIMSVGDTTGEPVAVTNGAAASQIQIKIPETAKNGDKFVIDLVADELHVFKEGGSGDKYTTSVTPLTLTVGTEPTPETTTTTTTPPTTTTTTTTTAPVNPGTTTTTN